MANLFFPGSPSRSGRRRSNQRRYSYVDPKVYLETPNIRSGFRLSRRGFKLIILAGLSALTVWLVFLSPLFSIKVINLKGESPNQEVAQAIEALRGKNIFRFGGRQSERDLVERQLGLKKIRIVRGLPSTIVVYLVQREPVIVWISAGKRFLVDKEGVAIKPLEDDRPDLVSVEDTKGFLVVPGQDLVPPRLVEFVRLLNIELAGRTDFQFAKGLIFETTFLLTVQTKQGIELKFSTIRSLEPQVEAVRQVWQDHRDEIKQYIDVRVADFVYYK